MKKSGDLNELEKLKNNYKQSLKDISDLNNQRKNDLEVINYYKEENKQLIEKNNYLEKQIYNNQLANQECLKYFILLNRTLNDEMKTLKSSDTITIEQLRMKNIELQSQVEGYKIMEEEVKRMRHRVDALMKALEEEEEEHSSVVNKLKQDSFQNRYNIEQEFRKRIIELREEFKREAFEEMEDESKVFFIKI